METIKTTLSYLATSIDFEEPHLRTALAFVAFNPIFWNTVARLEYNTHFLTKLCGSAKNGCYFLAAVIFLLGIGRDWAFSKALEFQEVSPFMDEPLLVSLGYLCIAVGQILVLSSMYQLGITGTYLGDYFGILMEQRVTAFPFNVSDNPMYQGSTLTFLGTTLIYRKPAGFVVTLLVQAMYAIALRSKSPFTARIYSADRKDQAEKETKQKQY